MAAQAGICCTLQCQKGLTQEAATADKVVALGLLYTVTEMQGQLALGIRK